MEINIKNISSVDFFIIYGGESKLADYYVKRLNPMDGILSAFFGNEPIGYIIYHVHNDETECKIRVVYMYTLQKHRRKRIAAHLLKEVKNLRFVDTKGNIKNVTKIYIALTDKICGFEYLYDFLHKNDYIVNEKMYLFRGGDKDDIPKWENYMEKHGNRLFRWLTETNNYKVVSFEDISKDTIKAIIESEVHKGGQYLMTPFLNGNVHDFVPSMSFAAFKENEEIPSAHCLVTSPDKISIVFSQMAATDENKNAGIILLPFIMSINRFIEYGYKRSVYAISAQNESMLAVANHIISKITRTKTTQYDFVKTITI